MDPKKETLIQLIAKIAAASTIQATLAVIQPKKPKHLLLILHPDKVTSIDETLVTVAKEAMNKLQSAVKNDPSSFESSAKALNKAAASHSLAHRFQAATPHRPARTTATYSQPARRPRRAQPPRPPRSHSHRQSTPNIRTMFEATHNKDKAAFTDCMRHGIDIDAEIFPGSGPSYLYTAIHEGNFEFALWIMTTFPTKINLTLQQLHASPFQSAWEIITFLSTISDNLDAARLAAHLCKNLAGQAHIDGEHLSYYETKFVYRDKQNAPMRFRLYNLLINNDKVVLSANAIHALIQSARTRLSGYCSRLSFAEFAFTVNNCLKYAERHGITLNHATILELLKLSTLGMREQYQTLLAPLMTLPQIQHLTPSTDVSIMISPAITKIKDYCGFIERNKAKPTTLCSSLLVSRVITCLHSYSRYSKVDFEYLQSTLASLHGATPKQSLANLFHIAANYFTGTHTGSETNKRLFARQKTLILIARQLNNHAGIHIDTGAIRSTTTAVELLSVIRHEQQHNRLQPVLHQTSSRQVRNPHATFASATPPQQPTVNGAGGGAGAGAGAGATASTTKNTQQGTPMQGAHAGSGTESGKRCNLAHKCR